MEPTTFNIGAYVLIPILATVLGGWVGAFFGNKYQKAKEDEKMREVRAIAIKALNVIRHYKDQSYINAENQFNTDLTVAEKRTIIVLLHKLGIPIIVPTNEAFDIHRIHFADRIIDEREIDGIVLQINQRHCDNLFFIDAESYFGANRQYITVREVGKRYVREVLAKSHYNSETKQTTYNPDWVKTFGLGEYLSLRYLHEQACFDVLYDQNGNAISEKIDQILHEIDLGLWDNYLFGNYEMYKNAKSQIEMANAFQRVFSQQQQIDAANSNK